MKHIRRAYKVLLDKPRLLVKVFNYLLLPLIIVDFTYYILQLDGVGIVSPIISQIILYQVKIIVFLFSAIILISAFFLGA